MAVAILCAFFSVSGIIINDLEVAIVFAVVMFICSLLTTSIQRKYDMTYQETDEYLIMTIKGDKYKVYYDNISDWQWNLSVIFIQDESWSENDFLNIHCRLLRPEILITKLIEMAFSGKFPRRDGIYPDHSVDSNDPTRGKELVRMIKYDAYYYLLDEKFKEEIYG